MDDQIKIEIADTPEKYASMADMILTPVLELLKALSALESEIHERNTKLDQAKIKAGIPYNQMAPGSKELWNEYQERYGRLVTRRCTEKLLKRGYAGSFGKPGKYDYLNTGCKIVFTMKSVKKATMETFFHQGIDMKNKFMIKDMGDEWKIDEVKYAFSDETTWHEDRI